LEVKSRVVSVKQTTLQVGQFLRRFVTKTLPHKTYSLKESL